MNVLPVIHRELRVASRHPATLRLRLVFATGALLAAVFGLLWPEVMPRERGQAVLVCLAAGGLALSLGTGAYLTADCVSGEKRDGTLGLLFLTPLRGWEIVLGKFLTHGLQVGAAWLAIVPIYFLPVLQGGVTWWEVVRLLVALLTTMLLSLSAGVWWSTACVEARTTVLATAATMLALTFVPWSLLFVRAVFLNRGLGYDVLSLWSPLTLVVQAFDANYGLGPRAGLGGGSTVYWCAVGASLLLGALLAGTAASWLPRRWRRAESGLADQAPGPASKPARRQLRLSGRWTDAVQSSPGEWWGARSVGRPRWLAWLRGGGVGMFGVMLVVSVGTRHWETGFMTAFCVAYALHLAGRIEGALAVTRRVHEDRQSGALELLLVSEVTEADVIRGHQAGLRRGLRRLVWELVGLNVALQAMVVLFPKQLHMTGGEWTIFTAFFTGGAAITVSDFAALRWLGLREGMRGSTHVKAARRVLGWLMLPPWLGFAVAFPLAIQVRDVEGAATVFAGWAVLALLWNGLLVRRCRRWLKAGLRQRVAEGG